MKKLSTFIKLSLFLFVLFSNCLANEKIQNDNLNIDLFVKKVQKEFNVPGIAIAVVKDGKTILSKGYGYRDIEKKLPVTNETLFGIASNTKAFTATALAILVDEGKLKWNDKVTNYISYFKMYDPYVTNEFTITDLLTHRSGLGLGAGDLLAWPASDFSRREIIEKIRYLKPVSSFRTKYDYDNLLYMVAGEVVHSISGESWESFIETRIFKPLNMNSSLTGTNQIKTDSNIVTPYIPIEGKLIPYKFVKGKNLAPAGSIISNIKDMSKWVNCRLYCGEIPNSEKTLFSKKQCKEMWTPKTILPISNRDGLKSNFKMYGLGLVLQDYNGFKIVSHTGGLPGMVSKVTMIPSKKIGIIVLTNQQSGYAFRAITNNIMDKMLGINGNNWLEFFKEKREKSLKKSEKIMKKDSDNRALNTKPTLSLKEYCGIYKDAWRGDVEIFLKNNKLNMKFSRTNGLNGIMEHWQYNTFVVKWEDRTLEADCFVTFNIDYKGKVNNFKMKPISPLTDFSYDFQDLFLVKQK